MSNQLRVRGSLGAALALQSDDSESDVPEGPTEADATEAGRPEEAVDEGASSDASLSNEQHASSEERDAPDADSLPDDARAQAAEEAAKEAAEVQALLDEESVVLLDAEELARLSEVDCLTGVPRADDILLHALPMCAPYAVLANYKHKVVVLKPSICLSTCGPYRSSWPPAPSARARRPSRQWRCWSGLRNVLRGSGSSSRPCQTPS